MLDRGRNCWRIEQAERAALVVDAADYFRLARKAMLRAQAQILMIGWDFDTRIFLDDEPDDEAPEKLGPLLSWIAKHHPQVSIHILKWDLGAIKLLGRGTTVIRLARWAMTRQISFRLDGAHPVGASHHQKILVIDDKLAFCGGIDMTASRWDTREHRDRDDRRKRPTTGRRYRPWHDSTMAVDGDAAKALGDLARERWKVAGGEPIAPPAAEGHPWPPGLVPHFRNLDIGVSRTRGAHGELPEVREIEALFIDMIAAARRFLYAENQFFASRAIAEAIAERLAEPDGPEFVIVNPKTIEGAVEQEVMGPARACLMEILEKADVHGRFRIYYPVTTEGEEIYVHSKVTVVDDLFFRVGSANMNNRSMGLDSECDLTIEGRSEAEGGDRRIEAVRSDLLAEHLGVSADDVRAAMREKGSLIAAIEALRGSGRTLVPLEPEEPNALEAMIASTEALDPESAGKNGTPPPRPGLLAGMRSKLRRARRR
jgi:phosphatidylserine/phosphatidylglycerophosphate/cardiolipin synthase-like enzyme